MRGSSVQSEICFALEYQTTQIGDQASLNTEARITMFNGARLITLGSMHKIALHNAFCTLSKTAPKLQI